MRVLLYCSRRVHRSGTAAVMAGLDPAIHDVSQQFETRHGPPGQARGDGLSGSRPWRRRVAARDQRAAGWGYSKCIRPPGSLRSPPAPLRARRAESGRDVGIDACLRSLPCGAVRSLRGRAPREVLRGLPAGPFRSSAAGNDGPGSAAAARARRGRDCGRREGDNTIQESHALISATFAGEVRRAADADRAEEQLVGLGLRQRDQLLHVGDAERWMDHENARYGRDQRNRRQLLGKVGGGGGRDRHVRRIRHRGEEQRVAVVRRARDLGRAELAVGARLAFDDEWLAEVLAHALRQHTGHDVAGTARPETEHDANRTRGIIVGPRWGSRDTRRQGERDDGHPPRHLIACGLIGEPVPPVMISGGPQKKNS